MVIDRVRRQHSASPLLRAAVITACRRSADRQRHARLSSALDRHAPSWRWSGRVFPGPARRGARHLDRPVHPAAPPRRVANGFRACGGCNGCDEVRRRCTATGARRDATGATGATLHAEIIGRHFHGRRTVRLWTDDGSPVREAIMRSVTCRCRHTSSALMRRRIETGIRPSMRARADRLRRRRLDCISRPRSSTSWPRRASSAPASRCMSVTARSSRSVSIDVEQHRDGSGTLRGQRANRTRR